MGTTYTVYIVSYLKMSTYHADMFLLNVTTYHTLRLIHHLQQRFSSLVEMPYT